MKSKFMFIKIILLFITFVGLFACSGKKVVDSSCNKDTEVNETEIYSKIAKYWLENSKYLFEGKAIIIFNKTYSLKDNHPNISLENHSKNLTFDTNSIEDFQNKNQESIFVNKELSLTTQYQYLSPESKFYKEDLAKDFINTYPNAALLIGFSRIGFNKDYSNAILYSYSTFDRGSYIELERQNCEWKIKQENILWHH